MNLSTNAKIFRIPVCACVAAGLLVSCGQSPEDEAPEAVEERKSDGTYHGAVFNARSRAQEKLEDANTERAGQVREAESFDSP